MSKKPIIVFEGIEGSGKSHHISIVSKYLKRKKISHIKIREPGGSINSEKIRRLILNQKSNFNKNTDLLLYLAARSENIDKIKKNYKKKIILIDRFTDSTFLNLVNKKNLYLRLKKRKSLNRYDKFDMKFYSKIQKGFILLSNKNKKIYKKINSNLDLKKNEKLILDQVVRLLKK